MSEKTEDKKKNSILKSFIDYFYGNFVVLLLGFVSLPIIFRVLSPEEYGRTSLFSSVVSIIYICAILGLDQSYIRYFYKDNVDRVKLFKQCLKWPLILILVLAGIYGVFSDRFNVLLFGKGGIDVTILVMGYTITSVFERFLFLNIRMDQKGKLYSNLNILSKVLYIGFIFLFVYILGDDFRVGIYALTLPLMIVTLAIGIRFVLISRKQERVNHEVTQKELLSYGIPFVPMLLMEWLLSSMDKWSIRIYNGFDETGVYGAAMQIMTILLTFKITYVAFWAPIAMEKYEKEPEETVKPFFADMFQKVQFLGMVAAFLLTVLRGVIVLILGDKYRAAIKIIPFLSLMPILSILFEMVGQGVKFKGKIKYFNYASIAAIVMNLVGNTLLVPRLKGLGAAMATALTYIVYFIMGTIFGNKCYPVKYDFRQLTVSLILYVAYSFYASYCTVEMYSIIIGTVLIGVVCLINKKTLISLLSYAKGFLAKLKK